eukprot:712323-Pleurochrysis_carterae.AAC.2
MPPAPRRTEPSPSASLESLLQAPLNNPAPLKKPRLAHSLASFPFPFRTLPPSLARCCPRLFFDSSWLLCGYGKLRPRASDSPSLFADSLF